MILNRDEVKEILKYLGAEIFVDRREHMETNTICHNKSGGSLKLHFFDDSGYFHCYTGCSENLSIYDVIIKNRKLYNEDYNFHKAIQLVEKILNKSVRNSDKKETIIFDIPAVKKIIKPQILKEHNQSILNCFEKDEIFEWQMEGISKEMIEKFQISFYRPDNQIIIPHYDIDGRLIGIRVRNLDADAHAKYCPFIIGDKKFNHPLRLNLYGLNFNKEDISKTGTVFVFEAEKSVLKMGSLFNFNNSVATCNNQLGECQLNLLLKIPNLREIVFCLDRDYENNEYQKQNKLFEKYEKEARKAGKFIKTSFIWDNQNLLENKDAPIDKGAEVFKKLYSKRIDFS